MNVQRTLEGISDTAVTATSIAKLAGAASRTSKVGPSGMFSVQLSAQVASSGDAGAKVGAYAVVGFTVN